MKRISQFLAFLTLVICFGAPGVANSADRAADGDKVCTQCHDQNWPKPIFAIYQTKHGVKGDPRTPNCQTCHGGSEAHIKSSGSEKPDVVFAGGRKSDAEVIDNACLTCHKGTNRARWAGSAHEINQVSCTNCHNIHAPAQKVLTRSTQAEVCFACHKEQRADTHKISAHPLATPAVASVPKMVCSDCHNPHGSAGPKLVKRNSVNETCWTCHAEKRGPFLFEHQPVSEDCTNCHTPHGSNITPLLKTRPPFLCDECHDGPHNSQAPYGTAVAGIQGGGVAPGGNPNSNAVGRACMNCHVMIHGSNSPAGAYLHR